MNDNIYYKVHFARYFFFKYVTLVEQTGFDQLLNRFLSWPGNIISNHIGNSNKVQIQKVFMENFMEPFPFRNLLFSTLLSRSMKHSFDK